MPSVFYTKSSIQEICQAVSDAHNQHKTVVLATGIFDLLHQEHINYLNKAKLVGDLLVVAIESNTRTRKLKGEGRPIHGEEIRLAAVRALSAVDHAFILPEDFDTTDAYEELLVQLQPDIYAVSSHSIHLKNKKRLMEKHGGKLMIVHEHNPHISTTQLLATHQTA